MRNLSNLNESGELTRHDLTPHDRGSRQPVARGKWHPQSVALGARFVSRHGVRGFFARPRAARATSSSSKAGNTPQHVDTLHTYGKRCLMQGFVRHRFAR